MSQRVFNISQWLLAMSWAWTRASVFQRTIEKSVHSHDCHNAAVDNWTRAIVRGRDADAKESRGDGMCICRVVEETTADMKSILLRVVLGDAFVATQTRHSSFILSLGVPSTSARLLRNTVPTIARMSSIASDVCSSQWSGRESNRWCQQWSGQTRIIGIQNPLPTAALPNALWRKRRLRVTDVQSPLVTGANLESHVSPLPGERSSPEWYSDSSFVFIWLHNNDESLSERCGEMLNRSFVWKHRSIFWMVQIVLEGMIEFFYFRRIQRYTRSWKTDFYPHDRQLFTFRYNIADVWFLWFTFNSLGPSMPWLPWHGWS